MEKHSSKSGPKTDTRVHMYIYVYICKFKNNVHRFMIAWNKYPLIDNVQNFRQRPAPMWQSLHISDVSKAH